MRRAMAVVGACVLSLATAEVLAQTPTPTPGLCTNDEDCSDGRFCNGPEQCVPGTAGADARGCFPINRSPCAAGQRCDEFADRCVSGSCSSTDADADRDGVVAIECGGTDCDDTDATAHPGKTETCDDNFHDEDCNFATFGDRDIDGDGWVSDRCCNSTGTGLNCGTDCDDAERSTNPTVVEVCDTIDNNCNGAVDEGVTLTLHHDRDHDGYGDPVGPVLRCAETVGLVANDFDCDDEAPHIAAGSMTCVGPGLPTAVRICRQEPHGPDLTVDDCAPQGICATQPNGRGVCLGPQDEVPTPPTPTPTPTIMPPTITPTPTLTPTPTPAGLTCLQCLQDPTCPAPCSVSQNVGCVCFVPPPL